MNITIDEAVEWLEKGKGINLYCMDRSYRIVPKERIIDGKPVKAYVSSLYRDWTTYDAEHAIRYTMEWLSKDNEEVTIKYRTELEMAMDLLEDRTDEEILELLPVALNDLKYEEKLDLMSDLLCEEWHLITHHEFIRSVLNIFAKNIKNKK